MAFLGDFPRPLYGVAIPRTGFPRHSISFQFWTVRRRATSVEEKKPRRKRGAYSLGLVGTGVRARLPSRPLLFGFAVVLTVAASTRCSSRLPVPPRLFRACRSTDRSCRGY